MNESECFFLYFCFCKTIKQNALKASDGNPGQSCSLSPSHTQQTPFWSTEQQNPAHSLKVISSSSRTASYPFRSAPLSLSPCICLFLFISPVRVGCRLHSVAGSWQPFALFLPISFGVIPLLLLWSAFPSCLPQSPVVPLPSPLFLACCLLYDCSAIGLMISVCIAHFMHNFRKFHCGFAADVELLLLLLLFVESLFQNPLLSTVLPFTLSPSFSKLKQFPK